MNSSNISKAVKVAAISSLLSFSVSTAHAQSTEETVGAIVGGVAGTLVGGELDNKGSKTEGKVIGAVVGGTLGYVIGGELEKDDDYRGRYNNKPGEYYTYNGEPYRRYRNDEHGYVSFPISSRDPYYYRDGRKKSHPVFAEHPGRGKGKGLRKRR